MRRKMRVPRTVEEFERDMKKPRLLHLDTGIYYWIKGEYMGRRVVLGPYLSEKEAYEVGYEQLSTDFVVLQLKTKDETKASRLIRAMVLEETSNLGDTFRRFRHKLNGNQKEEQEEEKE